MTLVPSWQQLANPANAAEANLLQPLFAAAASDADWRRPLIVDSSGGLRLQAEQAAAVFPAVVYERAAVAASASRGSSSYNKRSSKASSTATSAVVGPPPAHGPIMTNPPPAHSNSYSTSSTVRNSYHSGGGNGNMTNVKKEPSQLSPVKKRIKETKDHTHYELYRQQQQEQQQQHSPGNDFYFYLFLLNVEFLYSFIKIFAKREALILHRLSTNQDLDYLDFYFEIK